MIVIAVLILILYYYFFVNFEKYIQKPQNISKPVVNLKNKLSNGTNIESNKYYDYDSGSIKGPFEYSIQFDQQQVVFTAHDNDYNNKSWVLPLTVNYFWRDGQVVESDSCYNSPNNSNVRAEGKMLFDYIQNNNLISDQQIGKLSSKIFHTDRLFYFKCNNNKIDSLHSCPPGTILNNQIQCEKIHSCTGQTNNYQYPDENSKFNFFKCINEKPHPMTCPSGEIFEYDKCVIPDNLCEVRSDGFLQDVDRKSFMTCIHGKPILHYCPPYTYALNGQCENEVCENKHDNFVPIKTDNGTFEYASSYGQCKNGRLIETFDCPTLWNYWDSDVNLLHLPQVFDPNLNSCTKPVLCENVKITDSDIIIPQYNYAKYLKNWDLSPIFDLITGYKCDQAGNRIRETLDPGELIINFRKTKNLTTAKIPTNDATKYFDNDQLKDCPVGHFFDGFHCKIKNPNAFSFRNLDIFELDGLNVNGWLQNHLIDYSQTNISCTGDFKPMNSVRACIHKDCIHLEFLYQLKGSIKIDDEYECVRNGNNIEKHKYNNAYNLKLEFWDQRQTTNAPQNICTFGTNIKTGNFVLDSTIFMTCDHKQPFVFCPSNATETIQTIGNTHACVPKRSVYEMIIPKNINVLLYKNEISGIQIPNATNITIDNTQHFINSPTFLTISEILLTFNIPDVFFYFMCDDQVKLKFSKLPTNPENVYLENGVLKINQLGVYNIIYDRQIPYIKPQLYNLKDHVTDFNY